MTQNWQLLGLDGFSLHPRHDRRNTLGFMESGDFSFSNLNFESYQSLEEKVIVLSPMALPNFHELLIFLLINKVSFLKSLLNSLNLAYFLNTQKDIKISRLDETYCRPCSITVKKHRQNQ